MNRTLPRYASAFADRHGKQRIRLRRTGFPTIYIAAEPGTPEFTEAYRQWEQGGRIEPGMARIAPGTFDDVIVRFYRSTGFTSLKPQTQTIYRGELDRFRAKYGTRNAATMTARHIANLMGKMADTPSAANNLKKRLGQVFDFAILMGIRTDNPARVVRAIRIRSTGYATWQEEQIAAFEAKWAQGTRERLAFDLALYTGQRKSDVHRMGPQHVSQGRIRVTQMKTGKTLLIPVHPKLAASIAASEVGHLAFLTTAHGKPFTRNGIGNWFRTACDEAGLQGFAMHGLRKAAARRMAEQGLSNQLIKSITGHTSDAEVARYTRDAEQVRLADLAMDLSIAATGKARDEAKA